MLDIPLTLGIEEEFLIVNRDTRELSSSVEPLLAEGKELLGEQIKAELLKSQIEVGSNICQNIDEIRAEIIRLRRTIHELAEAHNCEIIAASTHPFSHWQNQEITEGPRYEDMVSNMQQVTRRLLICGMHVHIGFGQTPEHYELIMDIQNQLRYFLPHLLAYSVSSPFWQGRDTGIQSYRSIVYTALPRSGIPPIFSSFADYVHMVRVLGDVGTLKRGESAGSKDGTISGIDATRIWWDSRPHLKFGTLEIRVCDICTRVEDAVTLVALIQVIVSFLIHLRELNLSWRIYPDTLVSENKWRSARHGVHGKTGGFRQAQGSAPGGSHPRAGGFIGRFGACPGHERPTAPPGNHRYRRHKRGPPAGCLSHCPGRWRQREGRARLRRRPPRQGDGRGLADLVPGRGGPGSFKRPSVAASTAIS